GPFDPVPAGVLDLHTVWRVLLGRRLGIRQHPVDLEALLTWTRDGGGLHRYAEIDDEFRKALRQHLVGTSGPAAGAVLDCIDAGYGADAVPLGLTCRVVFHESGGGAAVFPDGAVRLERFILDHPLTAEAGRQWAAAAESVVRRLQASEGANAARPILARGDQLAAELKAVAFV